jgi:hypothetical protein
MRVKVPSIKDDVTPNLPTQRLIIKVKLGLGREKPKAVMQENPLGRLTWITYVNLRKKHLTSTDWKKNVVIITVKTRTEIFNE